MKQDKFDYILILDFGSQYTQLIARRFRELGYYSLLKSADVSKETLDLKKIKAVVLSGGPDSIHENNAQPIPNFIFALNVPILGICYGMHLLADYFKGQVETDEVQEYGKATLTLEKKSKLFNQIPKESTVWMSHSDKIVQLPKDFICSAKSNYSSYSAIEHQFLPIFALQFHPEVAHTDFGNELLKNFAALANIENNWNVEDILKVLQAEIQEQVGNEKVILALSGGVDSSVLAFVLKKALGKQLELVFVNNGLLRHQEAENVIDFFENELKINIHYIDAVQDFLQALDQTEDPEKKRKVIGETFIKIFDQTTQKIGEAQWLAQGTIYPDIIESAASTTGKAKVIKSHHNVGGLPKDMKFKLLEPFKYLFKDEVRKIGTQLGLPDKIIKRHPFPGPGLAVRIIGKITTENLEILRKADHIFIEKLRANNLYDKVSQAFAAFLPIKTVGVVGDNRRYGYVIALRSVNTTDFMTAHTSELSSDFLAEVSTEIINKIPQVARVVYDISSKPPATIEWE